MEKKTGYLSFVFACVVTALLASMLPPPGILPVIEVVRRWLTDCVWRRGDRNLGMLVTNRRPCPTMTSQFAIESDHGTAIPEIRMKSRIV